MENRNPKDRVLRALNDEDLDKVTGGTGEEYNFDEDEDLCPACHSVRVNGHCENLQCFLYAT